MTALPRLYPILDASFLPGDVAERQHRLARLGTELLDAGVTLLQYRNKSGSQEEIRSDAAILRDVMPPGACTLILNDYPELVAETGFDGLHVGQEDMPPEEARKMVGSKKILGFSTHNQEQLKAADQGSADYLAFGPVFATSSKQNPDPVVGTGGLALVRLLTSKTLVAIGGIKLENCREVLDAGADSVAVISAVFADAGGRRPAEMVRLFRQRLRD